MLGLPGTTTACALKLFRNFFALEKDPEQVNFIKMRIQGIWDCPDQDQEVGVLGDLEDVSESEQTQDTVDQTEEDKGDNLEHSASPVQPVVPDLLLD